MELTNKDIKRFWGKAKIGQSYECWEWQGTITGSGYGSFSVGSKKSRRMIVASRVSWIINNGIIPDKMFVCHKCDNPKCINPQHLFLGTHQDNVDDKVRKNRQAYVIGYSKVNQEIVSQIRNDVGSNLELAKKYGMSKGTISSIKNYRTWKI